MKLKFKATDQEEQGRQMVKYYFLNPKTTPCWVDDCFKYTPKQSTAFMYVEPNTDIKVEVVKFYMIEYFININMTVSFISLRGKQN